MVGGGVPVFARKADGILCNFDRAEADQEFLIFENTGPPTRAQYGKYQTDTFKCFQNCVDAIRKTFWCGTGDVSIASKYFVLAYMVYSKFILFICIYSPWLYITDKVFFI